MSIKVAVIGAGRMGRPIIARLVAAGYHPTVVVRSPEAKAAAEAAGWACASSVPEAVADAAVVITIVFDDQQLRSACLGPDGALAAMPAGAVLVQHTTCDPATVTLLAEAGARRGVCVLDAALSGNPRDIEAGQLTVWAGGEPAALDIARPVLESYASPVMPVGAVGTGQRIKLVNNALFVAQVGLAVEAVRVGAELGIGEEDLVRAVRQGSGASRALSAVAWIGADAVGARLAEFMIKDVDAVRAVAARAGTDLGLIGDVLRSDVVARQVLAGGTPPDRARAAATRSAPGPVKDD